MAFKEAIDYLQGMMDSVDESDRRHIRMALLCVNAQYRSLPRVPYWRKVRYTDDGCTEYQCLECKYTWEARTEPGWYQHFEQCDEHDEGASLLGDWYMRELEEPIYHPNFNFCPACGIQFKGAIRNDFGNDMMLGPRRLRIEQLKERRGGKITRKSSWIIDRLQRGYVRDEYWNRIRIYPVGTINAKGIKERLEQLRSKGDTVRVRLESAKG